MGRSLFMDLHDMTALELLLTRSSFSKLTEPAPAGDALENIISAGLRAPDHAHLSPYEFIVCQGQGLQRLTDIFVDAAEKSNFPATKIEKAHTMCFRAPMIIVAIMRFKEHEKVPRVEQISTTGCAVQNMQMAAQAQGFQGIWRTGNFAVNDLVRRAFDCAENDEIVGFLYLGTPECEAPIKRDRDPVKFVSYWN